MPFFQVMRNNAKSARSDLEYQCEQLRKEKNSLSSEVQQLQDSNSQLQLQCQCHLEDKRQLKAALSETQRTSADLERRLNAVQADLTEEKRLRKEEVITGHGFLLGILSRFSGNRELSRALVPTFPSRSWLSKIHGSLRGIDEFSAVLELKMHLYSLGTH